VRAAAPTHRFVSLLPALVFLAFASIALSWNLGAGSLLPSDDAIYARAAFEALQSGRLLDVTWLGRPLFEKGPVLFWALEAAQAVLGPTDLAVQVPGVVAGVMLLALLIAAARVAGCSRGAALAGAGLVLATNLLVFNARRPMTDVPGAALGLAGFLLIAFGAGRGRAVAGGALLGLSALVKLVSPAPFVLALILLQADRGFRRPARLALAFVAAAAVALPWHAAMTAVHGAPFLDTYFGYHLFRRATEAIVGEGASIYTVWFVEREGPTAILLLLAVVAAVPLAVRGNRLARAALALLAGASLPLAASRTALPHYLVPLLPGFGLAAAAVIDAAFRGRGGLASRVLADPGAALGAEPTGRGMRLRVLAGAALGLALLMTFLGSNVRDLDDPDYGPGAKAVCQAVRAQGATARLEATVDLHDPAISWYCDRAVAFLGIDPGFLAATSGIPMLADVVRPLDAAGIRGLAARRAFVVTVPGRVDALAAAADAAGARLSDRRDFPGRVLVTILPRD
jgi:4-amino-4-deoxy-L-arabinose transferase-like glycosyltransferase